MHPGVARDEAAHPDPRRFADRQQRAPSRRATTPCLKPHFASGEYVKVNEPAGTWDPATRRPPSRSSSPPTPTSTPSSHPTTPTPTPSSRSCRGIKVPRGRSRPPVRMPLRGASEHPHGLPVRHRLQADLPRGPGVGRARALSPGGCHSSDVAGERDDGGLDGGADVPSVLVTPIWVTPPTWPPPSSRTTWSRSLTCVPARSSRLCPSAGITRNHAGPARVGPRLPRGV